MSASGLPWYRKDVTWLRNPKILELLTMHDGFRSLVVWDASIAYATEQGTDGVIRAAVLPMLFGRRSDAERLVKVALWDEHPVGWSVHDFGVYQQMTLVTGHIRRERQKAASKGNCVRWHGPDCGCWARGGLRGLP